MKILLITLTVFAIVIVLFMVLALFARNDFTVQRTIIINKARQDVFEFIRFLENHRAFSKWTTKESIKLKPGTGTDGYPDLFWHGIILRKKPGSENWRSKKLLRAQE